MAASKVSRVRASGPLYAHLATELRRDIAAGTFAPEARLMSIADLPEANIARLRQRVSFTTADLETSALLDVPPNSAIGDVLRVITDEAGRAIYVGATRYRGDFDRQERPR